MVVIKSTVIQVGDGALCLHTGRQWVIDSGPQRQRRYLLVHFTWPSLGITKADLFWIWPNILTWKALISGRRYTHVE